MHPLRLQDLFPMRLSTLSLSFLLMFILFSCTSSSLPSTVNEDSKPNVIIVYVDDMGYGDLSSFGNPTIHTPHLDNMAAEGLKLTQFYVASPVCTPSRAALMTGCYPKRVSLEKGVLFPHSITGLNPQEETIAELLGDIGYQTALIGKWHLGHYEKFLPYHHGFNKFYGTPFSNDMSKKEQAILGNTDYPWDLPLLTEKDTLELNPDQTQFTKDFTEKSMDFIQANKDRPFFLYLAHPMPHIPIYASEAFTGKSVRGDYGDTIEELDWSVGQILKKLKELGIDHNTIVLFTSDNGPWKPYKTQAGSAGPLRGEKGTTWEGGQRVPCIIRWPDHIPTGAVQRSVVTNMDILPTVAAICNATLPKNKIDGRNVSHLLFDDNSEMEDQPFLYYSKNGPIEGIRIGAYKYLSHADGEYLFDLNQDISEEYNLIESMPELAQKLKDQMLELDLQLASEQREVGQL